MERKKGKVVKTVNADRELRRQMRQAVEGFFRKQSGTTDKFVSEDEFILFL